MTSSTKINFEQTFPVITMTYGPIVLVLLCAFFHFCWKMLIFRLEACFQNNFSSKHISLTFTFFTHKILQTIKNTILQVTTDFF